MILGGHRVAGLQVAGRRSQVACQLPATLFKFLDDRRSSFISISCTVRGRAPQFNNFR